MKRIAPFLVLAAGILWGMIGFFVRVLNEKQLGAMDIVLIRAIATSLLLFIYLIACDRTMLMVRRKDIWCFLGTGLCSIVFFNFCYFKTITLTSLSVAAVLLYTAPAIVMLLSAILFHEKITVVKIISIVATFVGCVLVTGLVGNEGNLNIKGIIVGLGSGLGYALYSIFSRYALERGYQSLTISFYTFLFAMFGTIPFCHREAVLQTGFGNLKMILFCLIFGLVSTVIPYITYTMGLKELENSKASIIASIEPVAATLLGVLVYREKITMLELLGIVLVIGAIIISNMKFGSEIRNGEKE